MATAIERVRLHFNTEKGSPGSYARIELVRDIEFLLMELEELAAELEITKTLVNWQAGFEK